MAAYHQWLGAGIMAAGFGAAVASGQGIAYADDGSASSPAASSSEAGDSSSQRAAGPKSSRGERAQREERSTADVRRSAPGRHGVQSDESADESTTAAFERQTPGLTPFDRRRAVTHARTASPEQRELPAETAEHPDSQEVVVGQTATAAEGSAPAATLARATVAPAEPLTIGGVLRDIVAGLTHAIHSLAYAVHTWWRDVQERFFGLPATPVVVPVTPDPVDPPVGPPAAGAPVLLWETNFTDIAEAMKAWSTQTGRWGQSAGENQYYTPDFENVTIDANGHLVIEVRREAAPDGALAPYNYTSARVVTYGKYSVEPPVRIVARLQMPYTQGLLPAFWMVGMEPGHEFDWPRQGEIDIVEYPGFRNPDGRTQWTGNIHGPAAADNTVDVKLHTVGADLGVDLSAGFHDYGIDWYPDRIVWHVDGVETGRVTRVQYEALGGDWTPFSGAWSHYLILNVAVGNPWTGDPDPSSQFPQAMKVDWVRVYSLAGAG